MDGALEQRKPLWEEIKKFSRKKYLIVLVLFLLALTGIVLPVIPGLALLFLALALIKKGWMAKIRRRFRLWDIRSKE